MTGDIFSLGQISDNSVGGKAYGLSRLVAKGLPVPSAFVIRSAQSGSYPDDLDRHYVALRCDKVAVRSSAQGEDGVDASFAVQCDTVLNVADSTHLRRAIDHCVASAATDRARRYQEDQVNADVATMNVVVQRIVNARVAGVVRIVHTLQEAVALEPGEILVTPITDIGWTPYFSLIGGLVTDLGSFVTHGAVIAKEYGLPCVVNTRQATRFLQTGNRVYLDGDTGSVTLLA
ncbi:MAG: PEP/pyruvate-binding domain-containing protein [Pseudomonadales bacterium]